MCQRQVAYKTQFLLLWRWGFLFLFREPEVCFLEEEGNGSLGAVVCLLEVWFEGIIYIVIREGGKEDVRSANQKFGRSAEACYSCYCPERESTFQVVCKVVCKYYLSDNIIPAIDAGHIAIDAIDAGHIAMPHCTPFVGVI